MTEEGENYYNVAWEPLEICAQVYPFEYPVSALD